MKSHTLRLCIAILCLLAGLAVAGGSEPASANVPASGSLYRRIPAGGATGLMEPATVEVVDQGVIADVDIALRLDHTRNADLTIYVLHPDGTRVPLAIREGQQLSGGGYGFGNPSCAGQLAVFDAQATNTLSGVQPPIVGRYRPEGSLTSLVGKPAAGRWTLEIGDDGAEHIGALHCFEVRINLFSEPTMAVTTTEDSFDLTDGKLSLREALDAANFQGGLSTRISLAPGGTYTLTSCAPGGEDDSGPGDALVGDLDFKAPGTTLILEGNEATITSVCPNARLLDVSAVDAKVTIRNVTFRGGRGRVEGGAVQLFRLAEAVLDNVQVMGAVTTSDPACDNECDAYAALSVNGREVRISRTVVADNRAETVGCAIDCESLGGLNASGAKISVTDSVIRNNTASGGTSCVLICRSFGGAVLGDTQTITLERTSIVSNQATAPSCPTCDGTGGVMVYEAKAAAIINSTIASNTAGPANSIGGLMTSAIDLALTHVTLLDNAGGFPNLAIVSFATTTATGTLIGASSGGPSGCAPGTKMQTVAFSFETGTGCGFSGAGNRSNGGDPKLGPPSGPAMLRTPLEGSPLLDVIAPANCKANIDQAGSARPFGPGCDIGAVERATLTSRFVPLAPSRVFDTRPGSQGAGPKGVVAAGESIDVQVAGEAGVPPVGVTAVVMNITATESLGAGFITAWPAGEPRPLASSLNLTTARQTRPNLVTVPVGAGGKVSIFSESGTHLLGDIAGYYTVAIGPQTAGRLVALDPARVLDTRPGTQALGPKGIVGRGQTINVKIAGNGGIPATGVSAVVLNITATGALAQGYVSAWPSDQPQPLASILNLNSAGDTAANLVMIPLGADGSIMLFAEAGTHLLADVTGYITGSAAPASASGLYVALPPTRVFDTRPGTSTAGQKGLLSSRGTVTTAIGGTGGVPTNAAAVVINFTATQTAAPGFVTSFPSGAPQPLASTLNVGASDTRANAAVIKLGTTGALNHYTDAAMHLIADTTGYFTG